LPIGDPAATVTSPPAEVSPSSSTDPALRQRHVPGSGAAKRRSAWVRRPARPGQAVFVCRSGNAFSAAGKLAQQ
jgi:hypothetical protein